MTILSYPYVEQDMSANMWRKINPNEDGVVGDFTGNSFGLTLTGDTATVAAGLFKLNGQILENTAVATYNLPAVASPTVYQVGVLFDPVKDVDVLGPLSLVAGVSGSFNLSGGKTLTPLYEVKRVPGQALSAGTLRDDLRWWLGPSFVAGREPIFPPGCPRGTQVYFSDSQRTWVRDVQGGVFKWVRLGALQTLWSKTFYGVATNNSGDFNLVVPPGVLSGVIELVTFSSVKATGYPALNQAPVSCTWTKEYTSGTRVSGRAYYGVTEYKNTSMTVGVTVITSS